jgi:hypothetical protein
VDIHLRLPARYRQRLDGFRRERGMSLTTALCELVRRGLDEPPPPRLGDVRPGYVRPGLVEEAVLASLVAIEHTRLVLEAAVPEAAEASEGVLDAAGVAADYRLTTARHALRDFGV